MRDDTAPEAHFHDLSKRSAIFRNKLIEEFQLLDNINDNRNVQAPNHTSRDIADPKARAKILSENPHQLIKFQVFKRTAQSAEESEIKTDRRLTRTRNINSLPIGAWASWVVRNTFFSYFVWTIIYLDVIFLGVSTELWEVRDQHWALYQFISVLDAFAVMVFAIEIVLKWIDSFEEFWTSGWEIADFLVTIATAAPEIVNLTGTSADLIFSVGGSFRTLRILRLLKIVFRNNNLKIIILTILQAFQSMAYIMILVIIVAYSYAVVAVYLYRDYTVSTLGGLSFQKEFRNIGKASMTLFQLLTLDQWDLINRDVIRVTDPFLSQVYIISWVWLGAFVFRNIFVGVMVNNFDKISEKLKEQKDEYLALKKNEKLRRKLKKELAVQGHIRKSMNDLKSGDGGAQVEGTVYQSNHSAAEAEQKKKEADVLQDIQKLLVASHGVSKGWEATVAETLTSLAASQVETMWPRDTLFKYLQLMENLQENMKEYEELQLLASVALMELQDT